MGLWEAFPDYDADGEQILAALDALDFKDASWRNDACPCFIKGRRIVWCDYADMDKREVPHMGTRFTVFPLDGEGCVTDEKELFAGDDLGELVKFLREDC